MIGKSKEDHELFELIESVAASEANILIQGETAGKELIANAIHYSSKRLKGPVYQDQTARPIPRI